MTSACIMALMMFIEETKSIYNSFRVILISQIYHLDVRSEVIVPALATLLADAACQVGGNE